MKLFVAVGTDARKIRHSAKAVGLGLSVRAYCFIPVVLPVAV